MPPGAIVAGSAGSDGIENGVPLVLIPLTVAGAFPVLLMTIEMLLLAPISVLGKTTVPPFATGVLAEPVTLANCRLEPTPVELSGIDDAVHDQRAVGRPGGLRREPHRKSEAGSRRGAWPAAVARW